MPVPSGVSVVIPAYNAAQTIARAVGSVLAQTLPPREIIVVDDASTDGTIAKARALGPVKPVVLPKQRGAGAARNAGIRAAAGPWIAFLDADDEWLPQKLEKQCAAAPGPRSAVFCASEEFGPDGISMGDTLRGVSVDCSPDAFKSLLKTNFMATPTVMASRQLLTELGGFDETLPVAEDQDLWIRLAAAGELVYVPETLVRVHVRAESLSSYRRSDQSRHVLPMIERHLTKFSDRLTPAEVRAIRGERLTNAGRIAFAEGDVMRGIEFMVRASIAGRRPGALLKTSLSAMAYRFMRSQPKRQLVS